MMLICYPTHRSGVTMNNRKYKTNPIDLLAQGQAIMSSGDESKYLFRVFAVNMVLSGTPASKVGASAGLSKAAVTVG